MPNQAKTRATLVEKFGSEAAYLEYMRTKASKGGKRRGPRTFDDPLKAKAAALKRWHP